MKVYMVNVETYYMGYGSFRCLGGIFNSLVKAKKYCDDLKEKIKETDPDFVEKLVYSVEEVNLNRGHSLDIVGFDNECMNIDFEEREIVLGAYIK